MTTLRRALNSATRFRVVRVPTLAAIGGVTRVSTRLLGGLDGVAAVYARGSYARGDFRPFLSDIDFAIAVGAPPGEGYDRCRRLSRRLGLVRSLNPFVRDPWQTIVTAPQWPLVARWGRLLGIEDWRLLAGTPPWTEPAPVDQRTQLSAWWNRQHFWTATAVRQALRRQTSVRELEASLKKARRFAGRLVTPADGPATPHAALVELDRSAARLTRDLGLAARWRPSPERLGPPTATERERRALVAIEAALDLEQDGATVLAVEGVLYIVSGARVVGGGVPHQARRARRGPAEHRGPRVPLLAGVVRPGAAHPPPPGPAGGRDDAGPRRSRRAAPAARAAALPVALPRHPSLGGGGTSEARARGSSATWPMRSRPAATSRAARSSPDARGVRDTLAAGRVARSRAGRAGAAACADSEQPTPPVLFEVGTLAVERLTEHLCGLGAPAARVPVAAGA